MEKQNTKTSSITFISPSRNNLSYLKWMYNSIRKNIGYRHEILLADKIDKNKMKEMAKMDHAMAHKHANSVLLEPNETGEIIWDFSTSANLEIACNVPGHYETGMIAKIIKD